MQALRLVVLVPSALLVLLALGCGPKAGGSCATANEAECNGANAAFVCVDSKWMALECRGPNACRVTGSSVDCDQSLANLNDACDEEGNYACTVDKKASLKCVGKKWTMDEQCPNSCSVSSTEVACN